MLLLSWPIITGKAYFFHDLKTLYYPLWLEGHRLLSQGQIPLWSRSAAFGFPILAESQSGLLYPPGIVLFFLLPAPAAFSLLLVLPIIIAAAGAYLFFREMAFSTRVSIFGALTYGLGGFFIYHVSHPNISAPCAYLPFTLWCMVRLFARITRARVLLLVLVVCFQALAGTAQYVMYNLIFACITACVICRGARFFSRRLLAVVLLCLLGLGLAAVQLLPTLELVAQSERAAGMAAELVGQKSWPPWNAITFVYPYFFGIERPHEVRGYGFRAPAYYGAGPYWAINGYIGLAPIILLACWLFFPARRQAVWRRPGFFLILLLLGTGLLMAGRFSPLFPLLMRLPGFAMFRGLSRLLYIFSFYLIWLALYSLKGLLRPVRGSRPIWRLLALILLVHMAIAVFFQATAGKNRFPGRVNELIDAVAPFNSLANSHFQRSFIFAVLTIIVLQFMIKYRLLIYLLIIINFVDLWGLHYDYNPPVASEVMTSPPAALRAIRNGPPPHRIANLYRRPPVDKEKDVLKSSVSLVWQVADSYLPSPLLPLRLTRFLEDQGLLLHPFLPSQKLDKVVSRYDQLCRAGIGYLIVPEGLKKLDNRFTPIFSNQDITVYRLRDARPIIDLTAGRITRLDQPTHTHWQASYTTAQSDRMRIRYLNDPGWRYRVNGTPVTGETVDAIFVSLPVPEGTGTVSAHYKPMGFRAGLYISVFCLALLVFALLLARGSRKWAHKILVSSAESANILA